MVKLKGLGQFRDMSLKRKLEVSLARINSLDKRRGSVKEDLKEISISSTSVNSGNRYLIAYP